MFIDKGPSEESVETLLKQLELGIPADALELLSLPLSLTRGEYLALYQAGIRNPDDLWSYPAESIPELVGASRAAEFEKLRPSAGASKSVVKS